MGMGSSDFNMGQAMGSVGESFAWKRSNDALAERLRKEMYVANSLESVAANRVRKIKAWDDVVWEIVKRVKDFDQETRYQLLGVCRGEDATPEDTMLALRKCQEFQFQKIKADAPKDNSDTEIPALRNRFENEAT